MKGLRFLFFILTALMLTGCKPEFNIKFELASNVDTNCKIVYYASSKKQGLIMEPVANIMQGKGSLTARTKYPTIVYLFQASSPTPSAIFYAKRGDKFKITGDSPNPADWDIKGNAISEEWSKWRLENKQAVAMGGDALNEAIAKYVKLHPDSKLSAALLILQYSRRDDEKGFLQLFKSLKPGATSDKEFMAALAVADMPSGELTPGADLKTLALSNPSGDADTLRFNSGKPALLIFRDSKSPDNLQAETDSLRFLIRAYPDSATRIIARISFDADSMTWIRTAQGDSLRNIFRGWMPFGVADSAAMAIGVRTVPFYVVADGKGKRLYGGTNLVTAIREFRKTASK